MEHYNDRVEIKYVLNEEQYVNMKKFLKSFGELDKHVAHDVGYKINTFYIMSWKSSCRTAKNHGKLRIRSYPDSNKIYLEEKSKIRNKYYKKRILINEQEKNLLKSFTLISQIEYFIKNKDFKLSNPIKFLSNFDRFEIDYTRIAYSIDYEGYSFRATIDKNLQSQKDNLMSNKYILELKTNTSFEGLSDLFLKQFNLSPYKISKYKLLKNI